jgi:hypothetical protein
MTVPFCDRRFNRRTEAWGNILSRLVPPWDIDVVRDTRGLISRGDLAFKMCEKCGTHTLREVLGPLGFHTLQTYPAPKHIWFVCRNPYSRAVSTWYDTVTNVPEINAERIADWGGDEFADYARYVSGRREEALASIHQTQTEWIGCTPIEGFIWLEELDTELPKLVPEVEFVHHAHATDYGDWCDYYDDETAGLIAEWAAEDFKRFGYPTEIPRDGT